MTLRMSLTVSRESEIFQAVQEQLMERMYLLLHHRKITQTTSIAKGGTVL